MIWIPKFCFGSFQYNIFSDSNFVLTKIFWQPKIFLDLKMFWDPLFLSDSKFCDGRQRRLSDMESTIFFSKLSNIKQFRTIFFYNPKFFNDQKLIWDLKSFGIQNYLGPTIFLNPTFVRGPKNCLYPKGAVALYHLSDSIFSRYCSAWSKLKLRPGTKGEN